MTRVSVLVLLLLLCFQSALAQDWRYPIRSEGGLQLINERGQLVSETRFDAVDSFTGIGPARSGGLWGYINGAGQWVLEPAFLDADPFENGRARVRSKEGWILIDGAGLQVTGRAYPDMTPLNEGIASYQEPVKGGVMAAPPKWGILSASGTEMTEAVFDGAGIHASNRVPLQRYRRLLFIKLERQWGFADSLGAWVVEPRFTSVRGYSDGLALVSDGSGSAAYIDTAGETVLTTPYPLATSFVEGRARVSEGGRWGFVDPDGTLLIPMDFEAVSDFAGGLAAVRRDGLWGYLDLQGRMVIQPAYEVASSFSGPLARVMKDGVEMWIDRSGNAVWTGTAR
jgi:hypothetical protein